MTQHKPSRKRNLSVTGLIAMTGFLSLVVIMSALFIGLWLDSLIGQRGPMTVCLLVLSMPLSLYLMVTIALRLVQQIEPPVKTVNRIESPENLLDSKEE
ncbi:MAG: hypothetical protein ACPG7F_15425 [Aggregatilineales bacterium]